MNLKYFKMSEFVCKCGCGDDSMDEDFLKKLDHLRGICEFPFHITSGKRCKAHNDAIGGAKNSQHLKGKAADIALSHGQAYLVVSIAAQMGFQGIGVKQKGAGRFIHLDNRGGDVVFWSY